MFFFTQSKPNKYGFLRSGTRQIFFISPLGSYTKNLITPKEQSHFGAFGNRLMYSERSLDSLQRVRYDMTHTAATVPIRAD